MQQELRLHGHIDDSIEYFVTVAARDAGRRHFYEILDEGLRVFAPGNEIALDRTGLTHWGNGGSFCEYMYGVEEPVPDLLKKEVANRLVLFGAIFRQDGELIFSNETAGRITYDQIFNEGHAYSNCFFFLTGSVYGALKTQQEDILGLLGRSLKRTPRVKDADDARLVDELFNLLGQHSHLYLVRLINKKHKAYADLFRTLYFKYRSIPDIEYTHIKNLAQRLNVDEGQQKRIRIAEMYSHRDNRSIVEEYRNILVECYHRGNIAAQENARLNRLKTLALRNKIPMALFEPLDRSLGYEKMVELPRDYIAETREIFSGLLHEDFQINIRITREDIVHLLHNKRRAMLNRDYAFEQILLDVSRQCDEKVYAGADISIVEQLNAVLDYLEHYEYCVEQINNIAFMPGVRIYDLMLREVRRRYRILARLDAQLPQELLFADLLHNRFVGMFGRQKLESLRHDLLEGASVRTILEGLQKISQRETLYIEVLHQAKHRLHKTCAGHISREVYISLKEEISVALRVKGLISDSIPEQLYSDVMLNIEKENFYLQELLPHILAEKNVALREDFLDNSGLERFYIEELENAYIKRHELDGAILENLRCPVDTRITYLHRNS
ncbi:MAG: TIGR04442 family protein [Desulfuromonadaceae bacterium]|nr:TIGR04442 family protein [Desulfuromonas sp.]MDY0185927.1 TIGR04442 family protein [Desulfuromonadaceae bacterium]